MINVVLVVFIAVVVVFAVRSSIKHFRGESACCGGGGETVAHKKLDGAVVEDKSINVSGMKCHGCETKVWNALNEIDGLSVTKASWKHGTVSYEATREVGRDEIKSAIEGAGYALT